MPWSAPSVAGELAGLLCRDLRTVTQLGKCTESPVTCKCAFWALRCLIFSQLPGARLWSCKNVRSASVPPAVNGERPGPCFLLRTSSEGPRSPVSSLDIGWQNFLKAGSVVLGHQPCASGALPMDALRCAAWRWCVCITAGPASGGLCPASGPFAPHADLMVLSLCMDCARCVPAWLACICFPLLLGQEGTLCSILPNLRLSWSVLGRQSLSLLGHPS